MSSQSDIIAAAIANAPDGGTITIPAGVYKAPPGGWLLKRSVTLSGNDDASARTILQPFDADPLSRTITLAPGVTGVTIRNLDFESSRTHATASGEKSAESPAENLSSNTATVAKKTRS